MVPDLAEEGRVICCLQAAFSGGCAARQGKVRGCRKTVFGSTVLLVMEDANGQPLSLGSGFFVRKS